jgi:peptidoglycan/xylan/chitin deacetylase (PgdA/CDA1 family)
MTVYRPGKIDAPILMYHHVSDQVPASRYVVTRDAFRAQMKILAEAGYRAITVSELVAAVQSGGILPEKPVVLTFDDAYLDVYEVAYPVLEAFGFTATLYVITSTLEPDRTYGYIKADQLAELAAAGWEIGSHSITHSDLKKTKLGFEREAIDSKAALENLPGVVVRSFSYPFAVSSEWMRSKMPDFGYDSAVGIGGNNHHDTSSLFYLSRREVSRSTTLAEFRKLLTYPPPPATSTPDPREFP